MSENPKSYFLVFLLILMWGSIAAGEKILLNNMNSFQLLFYLMVFSTIFIGLIILFKKEKRDLIKSYKKKDYFFFAFLGIFGLLAYNLLFILGLNFSSAQESFIINYTWPIWIIILANFILKERLTKKKILAILISFIGVLIIATNGKIFVFSSEHILGNIFAMCAAFFYGFFSVLGKKKKYEEITSMFFYFFFATVISLFILLIFSNFYFPSIKEIMGLIWLGGIATGISYFLWFKALRLGETAKVANLILLTPFVSLVYIHFLLGEKILTSSIIGLSLIILGVLIQQLKAHK